MEIKYCTACGSPTKLMIPPDDDHERAVCLKCNLVHYTNPKVVVGCIPEHNGKLLLCKRNIEPRKGYWTLPAGYLENGESVQDGAARETLEETQAHVEILDPYCLFNIPMVNQIYIMFRAKLNSDQFGPTSESTEVRLFDENEIPWDQIAFKVILQTMEQYYKDRVTGNFPFRVLDIHI